MCTYYLVLGMLSDVMIVYMYVAFETYRVNEVLPVVYTSEIVVASGCIVFLSPTHCNNILL